MFQQLFSALLDTLKMVVFSGALSAIFGLPLGVLLSTTRKGYFFENLPLNLGLGAVVNAARSIPFIILMLAIIPLTRLIVGTSIGVSAAIVPLTLAAIPFFARV